MPVCTRDLLPCCFDFVLWWFEEDSVSWDWKPSVGCFLSETVEHTYICRRQFVWTNGSLARSVGVNNAACRLLVDHIHKKKHSELFICSFLCTMASRGVWRGVNRTSILSPSSTLNNLCVFVQHTPPPTSPWKIQPFVPCFICCCLYLHQRQRNDTKHLRHAAFLGMHDSVQGSSANVLTGGRVSFGTSGFELYLDRSIILSSADAWFPGINSCTYVYLFFWLCASV